MLNIEQDRLQKPVLWLYRFSEGFDQPLSACPMA